jgi:sigma-54 specific flagellar transcriptional regulator A
MLQATQVFIIDDNQSRRDELQNIFQFIGVSTVVASSDNWLEAVNEIGKPECFLAGVLLGDDASKKPLTDRLQSIRQWNDTVAVLLVDGDINKDQDDSLNQMLVGSLQTPLSYPEVINSLEQAQRYSKAQFHYKHGANHLTPIFKTLVGSSKEMDSVKAMMGQVADKEVTVLITGESGTGKEVVARNLHLSSNRKDKPFVPVNCGAIPSELLESELFGHEKGAFTGAISSRAGRFEMAEGGTLFLDEIGDMPLSMQVKILRVLQERCFEKVGGNKLQSSDVRVIAATHRDLEKMIEEGSFREDLYYRLNVFPIEVPSLRERNEDIPLIINELVCRMGKENRGTVKFNSSAILSLCQHEWSGNVRELSNLVERMAIMFPGGVVGAQDLPKKYRYGEALIDVEVAPNIDTTESQSTGGSLGVVSMGDTALLPEHGIDLKEYLTALERNLIQQALDDSAGVVARAADRLGIRRTTLVEKMRKYDLQR